MDDAAIEAKLARLTAPVQRRLERLFGKPKQPKEVYGLLSEFMSSRGKLLRPALCLLSCKAVGGAAGDAVPAATAIEMFHNFTLIHDDIEDASMMRRGHPCLHVKYGLPLALNAGDGLFMMVWQQALELRGKRREKAQQMLLSSFTKVLEGQAVELGWYRNDVWDVDVEDYYRVVRGKTGALIAASCEVGGFLGGGDGRACRALFGFGMGIGVSFQIADDVLNIVGDERRYGKEIGGDIREGKRTLITIEALKALGPQEQRRLLGILKKRAKSKADVEAAIRLLEKAGAPQTALKKAEAEAARALRHLEALPKTRARMELEELAKYITRRER